jgi:glycosyltransferase involved in cell wall biosynthesis
VIEDGSPMVSVHVISYNQEKYVAEAIESAVNQDYPNLEVVVSDDASTDRTVSIIRDLESLHPGKIVALYNKTNVGVTSNSNRALSACSGDFVAFLGGDDVLLPGKISAQVEWFRRESQRVLCGHRTEVFYEDGSRPPKLDREVCHKGVGPESIIRHGAPFCGSAVMVKASAIPVYGFDESITIASDLLFWIEVLASGGEFGYVDGVYARYRRHSSNISSRHFDMLNDVEKTFRIVAAKYPKYHDLCMDSIIRHVVYFGGVRHLTAGNKIAARERFLRAVRMKPLFAKAWLRLAQTL